MKPLSPILLSTAAQAMALPRPRGRDPQICSLEFVMAVGSVAHRSETWCGTSWPLEGIQSVPELVECAATQGMLRNEPGPGDLVVFRPKRGRRVGVVLNVLAGGVLTPGRAAKCRVIMANAGGRIRFVEWWCSVANGDLFIRWFEARPGVPLHSRRAA